MKNSAYCSVHIDQAPRENRSTAGSIGGVPGALIGGIAGGLIGKNGGKEIMKKSKVFISFDFDNDSDIKTLIVNQARFEDLPFEIQDWSVKEHITGNWKEKARNKLKRVDQVLVLCGEKTHTAVGVSAEIELAQEVGVPYFLLKGRADKNCRKPKAARNNDKVYEWSWSNLKELIGEGR